MPGCPVAWVGWCGYIDEDTGAIISHLQDDREDEAGDWPKPSDMYKEIKNGQHGEEPCEYPHGRSPSQFNLS